MGSDRDAKIRRPTATAHPPMEALFAAFRSARIPAHAEAFRGEVRAFLQTPHSRMPDFSLSRTQADDVIAYILSLKSN